MLALALAAVLALAGPAHPGLSAQKAARVGSASITILSTMLADEGFGEWGFAALVEADGRRILFDTGANDDTVLRNVRILGVDLSTVETVVLSHNHADHTTGLMPLRRSVAASAPKALATLYAGKGLFWPRVGADGQADDRTARMRREYEESGGRVIDVEGPTEIAPGVWLTGPVPRVHAERNWSQLGRVRTERGDVEDTVPEDMALVLATERGLVYVFGCGHAGVINTLDYGRKAIDPAGVYAVIGGLHLFAADEAHLQWTGDRLKTFGVQQLVGAHCTGIEAVYRLRVLAGLTRQTCLVGSVGSSFSSKTGINALRIAK